MFTKYAIQDVGRNKCHFMLAFCSVFVVVLSTLVINTIIEKGPLVFLSLGQKSQGEIDAIISPSNNGLYSTSVYSSEYPYYVSRGEYYNFTQMVENYGD